jgi:hypothetical protein
MKLNDRKTNQSVLSKDPNDPDDFSPFEAFKMISSYSFSPIIGSLFHPTYMLVNAMILGKIEVDPVKCEAAGNDKNHADCIGPDVYLSAFGIGSSTMSIILLASGICFTIGLSQLIP